MKNIGIIGGGLKVLFGGQRVQSISLYFLSQTILVSAKNTQTVYNVITRPH